MIPVANWDRIVRLEEALRSGGSKNILELFEAAGLDPRRDFHGQDWRFVRFNGLDLRGFDFSRTRLYGAQFAKAQVAGAVFLGSDVEVTNLHRAADWRSAELDDDQRAILELKSVTKNHEALDAGALRALRSMKQLGEAEWVQLIKAAKSFHIAEQVYELMAPLGPNYEKNKYALTSLLGKSQTQSQLESVLNKFEVLGVPIDRYVPNTVISRSRNEQEARAWLAKYRTDFPPDAYMFNAVLSKIDTIEAAQDVLADMRRCGIVPDHVSLNPFIWKASTFEEALGIYDQLERPRTADMNAVLHHVEARHWGPGGAVEALLARGRRPNAVTFNILVHQSDTLERAWGLIAQMKDAGFRPDKFTLFNLLTRFEEGEVDEAVAVIARLSREGVDVAQWDTVRFLLRTIAGREGEGHRIVLAKEAEGGSWSEVLVALGHAFAAPALAADLDRALAG